MNYVGLKFDGGLFYKGCECKVIKQLVDWDDVYKAHQDFGYSFKKIQDNYLVRCCGKNSIWSKEEIKEMIQPNLKESIKRILREETEEYKVNLVTKIIYTLYDNISFIKQSTFNGKPLLIIYFDSDDTAANIESWFDEKISRDIEEWTSGKIVVCPDWIFGWDSRKKNADVFINTELIKYDNLGNVVNESVLREETREDKIKSILLQEFDKVFDELNLKVDYEENNYVYGKWFDKDGKDIFHRNDWGVIWIINCEPYKELYIYSKLVGLNEEEFEKILVEYFNNKYLDQFLQKPFKNVSDENHCLEDEY